MLFNKILQKLHFIFAVLVLLVGFTVMIAWVLEDKVLIQIRPEFAPMVFNTAVCFAALALSMLFSESRHQKIQKGAAGLVIIIAILTFFQYLFEINVGIDGFFNKPFYGVGVFSPGRMAVSTSVCFFILGIAAYFRASRYSHRMMVASASALVLGFSLIGFFSYVLGFNSEYGWGSFSRMALHTSLCFIALNLATIWQMRLQMRKVWPRKGSLVPFYVVIVGILTSMLIWQLLVVRDQERNKRIAQIRAENLKSNLDNVFAPLSKSLQHMARRFAAGAYVSQEMWQADAAGYFEEFDGLRRLIWTDKGHIVRWLYPYSNGGEKVLHANAAASHRELRDRLEEVESLKIPLLSRVFDFRTGGRGFVLLVPIFKGSVFQGTLSSVLVADSFFSEVVHVEGFDLAIFEDGKEIFSEGRPDPVFARDWKVSTIYRNMGVEWEIRLIPTPVVVRANTSALPGVVLFFGVSVSILLGVALLFYARSRETETVAKEAFEWKNAALNSAPLMIITLDENGLIREMNETAEKLLEYSTEEVAGKFSSVIFHDRSEVRMLQDKMEREMGRAIAFGGDFINVFFAMGYNRASEWTQISKSGKKYTVVMTASQIRDESGKITGFLEILEDVTQLKEKERLLKEQEMKIRASSRLASLGEMAAGIAHEINNPLAIINGHVGVLRRILGQKGLENDPDISKKVEAIESVVQRIAKIIRGLRSYAHESHLGEEELVKVEALVDDTLAFCHEKFKNEGVELTAVLEPQLEFKGHPHQISQVLLNLLNNSLDAVSGSRVKKVAIEARSHEQGVEIAVSDTGPGVPLHLRSKIMQPFFTTKEVGKGVGLGLSISQGIVQAHHGKFYLDESSFRTRFVIWLPKPSQS
ncbi:MAG: ATP-binding protein [Bdellovibrio sp.]